MRLIDYGSDIRRLESEREYTMMCRRAWLSYRWAGGANLKAIMRRALNGADMPELDGFDRFYEAVRRTTGHHERPEDVVLDMAGGAERALDYGCGNGWLAKELASKGMEVLGYDSDPTHQSRWKSLCRGAGKLRFTHEQGELAGTSKPVRYQFEGRTHPGSRSEGHGQHRGAISVRNQAFSNATVCWRGAELRDWRLHWEPAIELTFVERGHRPRRSFRGEGMASTGADQIEVQGLDQAFSNDRGVCWRGALELRD